MGPQKQQDFQSMKDRLYTTPVLAYQSFELLFIQTTDASKVVIVTILSQVQDGKERPIAYANRQHNTAEQNYSFRTGNVRLGVGNHVLPLLPLWQAFPS